MKDSCETVNSLLAHSWSAIGWDVWSLWEDTLLSPIWVFVAWDEGFSKTHIYTPIVCHSIQRDVYFCQVLHILSCYSISWRIKKKNLAASGSFWKWNESVCEHSLIYSLIHLLTHTFNKSHWMSAYYMPGNISTSWVWRRISHSPFPQGGYFLMRVYITIPI